VYQDLVKNEVPPYPLEKSILKLPDVSWMKHTADILAMLPLKWVSGGGYFQGSPSASSWGDVLRAVAPSQEIKGEAEGLFPVPILAGSLLDNVISSSKRDFFQGNYNSPKRHVIVCGPTGTGKTLLGTFALINECLEMGKAVLYLGPTRMLVEDAALEFTRVLKNLTKEAGKKELIRSEDILVSTGETFFDDGRLACGDFKAAFVVYEKVSNFFLSTELITHLGLALVDELHMLGNRTRGGSLDATLARLILEARRRNDLNLSPLRIICLSTGAMSGDKLLLNLLNLKKTPNTFIRQNNQIIDPKNKKVFIDVDFTRAPKAGNLSKPTINTTKPFANQKTTNMSKTVYSSKNANVKVNANTNKNKNVNKNVNKIVNTAKSTSTNTNASENKNTNTNTNTNANANVSVNSANASESANIIKPSNNIKSSQEQPRSTIEQNNHPSGSTLNSTLNSMLDSTIGSTVGLELNTTLRPTSSPGLSPKITIAIDKENTLIDSYFGSNDSSFNTGNINGDNVTSHDIRVDNTEGIRTLNEKDPLSAVNTILQKEETSSKTYIPLSGVSPMEGIWVNTYTTPKTKVLIASEDNQNEPITSPLVLSVYERPQRLLTYIQPTNPSYRFRPIHVGRINESTLDRFDLVLDKENLRFIQALDGWLPGHEKIIFASYSATSLNAFAKRAMDFGRSKVPSIVEDPTWLDDLRVSLVRSGARDSNIEYFLNAARYGIFFHYSGLGRETRKLMAEGYRVFTPVKYEPFILCATETISYGVNLPADALFLENINWPRSRYRHNYSIEPLTTNEYKNLVGRVGRHGHIKMGIIPTVVVNWILGKGANNLDIFQKKREEIESICSSVPVLKIDCTELQEQLVSKYFKKLKDFPGPVGRFYQLALLHAYFLNKNKPVNVNTIFDFLDNTYTVHSLFAENTETAEKLKEDLMLNMKAYFGKLNETFGDHIVTTTVEGSQTKYTPLELCLNLARNDTNPNTLLELDRFIEGLDVKSLWNTPELFGFKLLILVNLVTENKDIFTRKFIDPRSIMPRVLSKARINKKASLFYFKSKAAPVKNYLLKMGVPPKAVEEMLEHLKTIIHMVVYKEMDEHFKKVTSDRRIMATLRDALTWKVMTNILSLLLWVNGESVKSILDIIGDEFEENKEFDSENDDKNPKEKKRENEIKESENEEEITKETEDTKEDPVQCLKNDNPKKNTLDIKEDKYTEDHKTNDCKNRLFEENIEEDKKHFDDIDTSTFKYRYCDKIALLLDSYMVYGSVCGKINEDCRKVLDSITRRVRYGLEEKDISIFLEEIRDTRLYREEWLSRKAERNDNNKEDKDGDNIVKNQNANNTEEKKNDDI
jgi:hypothetical protein